MPHPGPRKDAATAARLGRGRKRTDIIIRSLCLAATVLGLVLLASILVTLFYRGFEAMSLRVFTHVTAPPGSEGGLLNAIVGSLIQSLIGTAIGTPIGMLVGTYLAEYAKDSWLGNAVRFVSDILLSAPSILIGLFVYQILVLPYGGFSGWAGIAALALIVIPVVVRTTEDMLLLVPNPLREAASALGMPRSHVIRQVAYRAARAGIITGVLLAVARVSGETAPLLFTVLSNQFFSLDITQPLANLPVTINNFINNPDPNWKKLAWTGALIITFAVLSLNIGARALSKSRNSK